MYVTLGTVDAWCRDVSRGYTQIQKEVISYLKRENQLLSEEIRGLYVDL
jgi:hypothetical protein